MVTVLIRVDIKVFVKSCAFNWSALNLTIACVAVLEPFTSLLAAIVPSIVPARLPVRDDLSFLLRVAAGSIRRGFKAVAFPSCSADAVTAAKLLFD